LNLAAPRDERRMSLEASIGLTQDRYGDALDALGRDEEMPAHLRADAPQAQCSDCQRWTVATEEFGQLCGMPQPDGRRCAGRFGGPR
jgi:hypothetical protein